MIEHIADEFIPLRLRGIAFVIGGEFGIMRPESGTVH